MKVVYEDLLNATEDIIAHQVNCVGVMGAGVARAIKSKFTNAYVFYRMLCRERTANQLLGTCQVVHDHRYNKLIVNCFAQRKIGTDCRQTDYEALAKCLKDIARRYPNKKVALPYGIGCGLAGGDWSVVSDLIEAILGDNAVLYKLK